jgi:hypothetical protein
MTIMNPGTSEPDKEAARNRVRALLAALDPLDVFDMAYTRYHQIGVDYARVIAGFNFRGEFAANITEDLKGDDGGVQSLPGMVAGL